MQRCRDAQWPCPQSPAPQHLLDAQAGQARGLAGSGLPKPTQAHPAAGAPDTHGEQGGRIAASVPRPGRRGPERPALGWRLPSPALPRPGPQPAAPPAAPAPLRRPGPAGPRNQGARIPGLGRRARSRPRRRLSGTGGGDQPVTPALRAVMVPAGGGGDSGRQAGSVPGGAPTACGDAGPSPTAAPLRQRARPGWGRGSRSPCHSLSAAGGGGLGEGWELEFSGL